MPICLGHDIYKYSMNSYSIGRSYNTSHMIFLLDTSNDHTNNMQLRSDKSKERENMLNNINNRK